VRRAVLALLLTLAFPAAASARAGDADPTFAAGGRTAFTVGAASAHVAGIAVRPDGRALIAGTAALPDGGAATSATQIEPAGALDLSFGTSGTAFADPVATVDAQPAGVALAPNGSAVVATTVTSPATGFQEVHLVRMLANGTTDPAFGTDGVAVLDFFNGNVHGEDVAIDPLGRILVAASTERDGRRYMSAFRLTPDGHRDPVFAGGRVDLDSRAFAGAILPRPGGGAILAGGTLRSYGNVVAVQVSDRGRRLDRFAGGRAHVRLANHTRPGTGARDMVLGPDGTLIIASLVRAQGARDRIAVVRLTSRGRLDTRFGYRGIFTAGTNARPLTVQHMVRDGRGRLLLAGAAKTARPEPSTRSCCGSPRPGGRTRASAPPARWCGGWAGPSARGSSTRGPPRWPWPAAASGWRVSPSTTTSIPSRTSAAPGPRSCGSSADGAAIRIAAPCEAAIVSSREVSSHRTF
jgi:uncharacterized delta-60 repeat protein